MRFLPLELDGVYLVELEKIADDRGFNARAWCRREFEQQGIDADLAQINIIYNAHRGTLRGFHYQAAPMTETKLFRVIKGGICDVIVDLRPQSPTYRQWTRVELWADRYTMLYVPAGCGQGFQTLADDTELVYQVSHFYSPEHGRGFRFDDPAFGVEWPLEITEISRQDLGWPPWREEEA